MKPAVFIAAILLLLAACQQGYQPINYHTGSEGIILRFTHDTPPPEVYEESDVPLLLELWNKGASDVELWNIEVLLSTDPFYANTTLYEFRPSPPPTGDAGLFHGKQPGYRYGERLELNGMLHVNQVQGLRQAPTSQVFGTICYPYETSHGSTLCVDSNQYNQNRQRQVCQAETLTFHDQGAPVAVTRIENRPTPSRVAAPGGRGFYDVVTPTFIIHIANVGSGRVLMPTPESKDERHAACTGSIPSEKLNRVEFNASLGILNLTCTPNPVMLRNDEGYTTCTINADEIENLNAPNYLGILNVRLGYLYKDTISTDYTILRLNPELDWDDRTVPERDEHPGYVNGEPRCDYCSRNRNDPACAGWPSDANDTAIFTCACSEKTCLQKVSEGRCVFGASWCPGTNYCCAP